MSSFEASTGKSGGIYGGVGKICPYLPGIGLMISWSSIATFITLSFIASILVTESFLTFMKSKLLTMSCFSMLVSLRQSGIGPQSRLFFQQRGGISSFFRYLMQLKHKCRFSWTLNELRFMDSVESGDFSASSIGSNNSRYLLNVLLLTPFSIMQFLL